MTTPETPDLVARLRALHAKATPNNEETCDQCGGAGEWFGHSPDCDTDDCALAGSIEDCLGQVEQCGCQHELITEVRDHLPVLLDALERMAGENAEEASWEETLRYCERQWADERSVMLDRIRSAEAERDRHKAALEACADAMEPSGACNGNGAVYRLARAALAPDGERVGGGR